MRSSRKTNGNRTVDNVTRGDNGRKSSAYTQNGHGKRPQADGVAAPDEEQLTITTGGHGTIDFRYHNMRCRRRYDIATLLWSRVTRSVGVARRTVGGGQCGRHRGFGWSQGKVRVCVESDSRCVCVRNRRRR